MEEGKVRVRFAPSPTGNLHVGGVRTALFNWLFARNKKGVFVLRVDDTDPTRSTEEYLRNILESMRWLGLDWDEGPDVGGPYAPYRQSQRLERYRQAAEKLLAEGKAFHCYCTPEELEAKRRVAAMEKRAPRYDGHCLRLTADQKAALGKQGRKPLIRFRLPEGPAIVLEDQVRGRVEFPREMLDDFVIVRSDGKPVYNFVTVIDEVDHKITHVIRGDDHLSNTPKQMMVAEALGFTPPSYAHLPQILGMDRARLSKRHGAAAVLDLREEGFLPEAIVNFLVLLGWSYNDSQELFEPAELAEKFDMARVGQTPAVFDEAKLMWMNGVYIRKAPAGTVEKDAAGRITRAFSGKPEYDSALLKDESYVSAVTALLKDGLKTLGEAVEASDFFFRRHVAWEDEAKTKLAGWLKAGEILDAIAGILKSIEPFSSEKLEAEFRAGAEKAGLKFKDFVHPTRFAVTGRTSGPSLFHLLEVLGRERCLERISAAKGKIGR